MNRKWEKLDYNILYRLDLVARGSLIKDEKRRKINFNFEFFHPKKLLKYIEKHKIKRIIYMFFSQ